MSTSHRKTVICFPVSTFVFVLENETLGAVDANFARYFESINQTRTFVCSMSQKQFIDAMIPPMYLLILRDCL